MTHNPHTCDDRDCDLCSDHYDSQEQKPTCPECLKHAKFTLTLTLDQATVTRDYEFQGINPIKIYDVFWDDMTELVRELFTAESVVKA
jgi:hypothetical protein